MTGPGDDPDLDPYALQRARRNAARRAQRARNRRYRRVDPLTGERVSLDLRCQHGTEAGYTNFGCNCLDLDDVPRVLEGGRREPRKLGPGCKPVGLAASKSRKQTR